MPLGLEASDDLLGVHARLDDLEGDFALDGLGLLGHEDGPHAALANLLQELVQISDIARIELQMRFDQRIREHGFTGLLLIRLLPIFPFNAVNFGCGLVGVRLRDYVLATAIGIVPGTFVYQFLFAKFGRRILTEGFRAEYLADPEIWLAIGLFAAFVIGGKWLSKKLPTKSAPFQHHIIKCGVVFYVIQSQSKLLAHHHFFLIFA